LKFLYGEEPKWSLENHLRFLRRLEQALKERDKVVQSDSGPDDESDVMDSPKASSPLLASSTGKSRTKSTHYSNQRRVANVYTFEPSSS
jgi:hypothetical protein